MSFEIDLIRLLRSGIQINLVHLFIRIQLISSFFNWVAISLRLLLRPPVSHTLAHTQSNLTKFKLFGGWIRSSFHLLPGWLVVKGRGRGGGGGCSGKKTPNGTKVEWRLVLNA